MPSNILFPLNQTVPGRPCQLSVSAKIGTVGGTGVLVALTLFLRARGERGGRKEEEGRRKGRGRRKRGMDSALGLGLSKSFCQTSALLLFFLFSFFEKASVIFWESGCRTRVPHLDNGSPYLMMPNCLGEEWGFGLLGREHPGLKENKHTPVLLFLITLTMSTAGRQLRDENPKRQRHTPSSMEPRRVRNT